MPIKRAPEVDNFCALKGWMNDPNGLVYSEARGGEYHLCYQHNPHGMMPNGPDNTPNIHWGHATSKDLIRWEHKDIALKPDDNGVCFSGSAVVDRKNNRDLVAFYTAHRMEGDAQIQEQCIARSKDDGETWTKYKENPVLRNKCPNECPHFRDPKVFWHESSNKWIMAPAAGQKVSFYGSLDLLGTWEHLSDFGEDQGAHETHPWECPDLFQMTSNLSWRD